MCLLAAKNDGFYRLRTKRLGVRVPYGTPGRICNPPFFCKSKQGISAEAPMKRGVGRVPKKRRALFFFGQKNVRGNFGRGALENGGNRAKTEACFYDINVTKAGFFAAVGQLKYNRGRRGCATRFNTSSKHGRGQDRREYMLARKTPRKCG